MKRKIPTRITIKQANHFLIFAVCFFILFSTILYAQDALVPSSAKDALASRATPDLQLHASLNINAMLDVALIELPELFKAIPDSIHSIALMRLNADGRVYVDTLQVQHRLLEHIMSFKRFDLVECRECQEYKLFVEEDTLILSRNIETTEKLRNLGKRLNIDLFVFGNIQVDEIDQVFYLSLKLVNAIDGKILNAMTLSSGHTPFGKFYWSAEAQEEGRFIINSPVLEQDKSDSGKRRFQSSDTLLLPEERATYGDESDRTKLDQLVQYALARLPQFINQTPQKIKRIAIGTVDKTRLYHFSTAKIRQLMIQAFQTANRFDIIDCVKCKTNQVTIENKKLLIKNSVDTLDELQAIRVEYGIEALLRGTISYNPIDREVQLGLQLVDTGTGEILRADTLIGKEPEEGSEWNVFVDTESDQFLVEGPIIGVAPQKNLTSGLVTGQSILLLDNPENLPESVLDLEELMPDIVDTLPSFFAEIPDDIKTISVLRIEGDDIVYIHPRQIRHRLKETIVSEGLINVVECFSCQNFEYLVYQRGVPSQLGVNTLLELQELKKDQNIDAILIGSVQTDEINQEIRLTLQLISTKDGRVLYVNTLKGKKRDEVSVFSVAVSTIPGFTYKHTRFDEVTSSFKTFNSSFIGLNLRYLTNTDHDDINFGFDFDVYAGNSIDDENSGVQIMMVSLLVEYLLPTELWNQKRFSTYLGVGTGTAEATDIEQKGISGIKLGGSFRMTSSIAVALDYYLLDSVNFTNALSASTSKEVQTGEFTGTGIGLSARFHF